MKAWVVRHRLALAVVVAFVLAVALTMATGGADPEHAGYNDPDNPRPDGGQAVARVLADRGVGVEVVRSADDLDRADVSRDTTFVVTSTEQLGANTVDRLLARARGQRILLVDPGPDVVDAVGVGSDVDDMVVERTITATCGDQRFDGLRLDVDVARLYTDAEGCFERKAAPILVTHDRVTLFGGGEALTNAQVLRADNAAIALRLLGQSGNVVWYVPDVTDVSAGDELGLTGLLPPWINPALWVLAVSTVGLVVWRARRLGPLATEPLPVLVRAIETTHSRGRLYRRSQDRAHAASALRAATLARGARQQGVRAQDTDAVVRGLAHQSGWPADDVADLVAPDSAVPESDRDLIVLANRLTELEEEARTT